jgi:hypothetical protein
MREQLRVRAVSRGDKNIIVSASHRPVSYSVRGSGNRPPADTPSRRSKTFVSAGPSGRGRRNISITCSTVSGVASAFPVGDLPIDRDCSRGEAPTAIRVDLTLPGVQVDQGKCARRQLRLSFHEHRSGQFAHRSSD